MPRVKIDYVVSFSSEDPEHPANNLLNREVSKKKWLCKDGESSCSVVLQLAKAVKISAVHIGAYNAALVEVLVARSETSNDEFQVLVPSSVFISREESKRGSAERVRSFTGEQLDADARHQRWDRLRIVCSQPYNKHCKYGLSFVHIDESESNVTAVPPRLTLALDTLSDDEEFKPGQLFAKHIQKTNTATTQPNTTNTGAQIRQATSQALKNIPEYSTKLMKTPITKPSVKRDSPVTEERSDRTRNTLLYTDDDERPHARIDSLVQRHRDEKDKNDDKKHTYSTDKKNKDKFNDSARKGKDEHARKNNSNEKPQQVMSQDKTNNKDKATRDKQNPPPSQTSHHKTHNNDRPMRDERSNKEVRKRRRSHSNDRDTAAGVPPHECLRGVVLVLSGYENPRRAHVRQLALALGAQVQRDWGPTCTHLICAFPNTPKLRTVRSDRGESVPVTRAEWIEECAARGKKLPWRWYATEPKHRVEPTPEQLRKTPTPPPTTKTEDDQSEGDTDDEIEKVLQEQKKRRLTAANDTKQPQRDTAATSDDNSRQEPSAREHSRSESRVAEDSQQESGESTDEDCDVTCHVTPFGGSLPNIFDGYTFAIDADPDEAELMKRYVCAYGGLVLEMSSVEEGSEVDYVVRGRGSRMTTGAGTPAPPGAWLARCVAAGELLPISSHH